MFVWGCKWILFMLGCFCPVYLIGRKSLHFYRPQTKFAKVMFLQVSVILSIGGHAWLLPGGRARLHWGGGHAWLHQGGHAWFYLGDVCGFIWGGMHGFIWGACVVLFRGCAWFYLGGAGGHAWFFQFFRIQWDMVNERAVRILLECILVKKLDWHNAKQ